MANILEELPKKDGFTYFLLARAYYTGRSHCDDDRSQKYFKKAADLGIEMANVYASFNVFDYDELFKTCSKLIEKYPDNHIIKYFLGFCYFYGLGTEEKNEKAVELFQHTAKVITYNEDKAPIDLYFLNSRYYLGLCYFHGFGVEPDLNKAHNLFRFSSVSYVADAIYAQAITHLLIEKENANPVYVYNLLVEASSNGSLPAVRKTMLCIKNNYGVIYDEDAYKSYLDYYESEKDNRKIYSELGADADKCPLIKKDGTIIIDDII